MVAIKSLCSKVTRVNVIIHDSKNNCDSDNMDHYQLQQEVNKQLDNFKSPLQKPTYGIHVTER
jgi:hypothetical protein